MKSWTLLTKSLFSFLFLTLSACAPISDKPPAPHESSKEQSVEIPIQSVPAPDKTIWDISRVEIAGANKYAKRIVFTFDDSPAKNLEEIAGVFLRFNTQNPDCPASATLFCNGIRINERTIPSLQTAFTAGFELGNHSYSHLDLTTLPQDKLLWEINRTDELLCEIDGLQTHLFRPPYGNSNEGVKTAVNAPIISWLIDTRDWTGRSEEQIYQTVFSQKTDGAIVLFHDGYNATVSALKRLLPDLKDAGYQVVSVSQASKLNDCPLRIGNTYIRERKPQERK